MGSLPASIVGKVHVGVRKTYPWQVYDDIETRDAALFGDHCDAFFKRAKSEDKAFNLIVGFHDVHRDMSRGGFANDSGPFDPRVKPYKIDPSKVDVPDFLNDGPVLRQELAEYYECINRFDQGVGFILDNLRANGLEDDTLVIVTTDNGPPFINAKTTLYDSGVHLPFMVRSPSLSQEAKGGINPNLLSFVDILPTMLDYAGLPADYRTKDISPPRIGRSVLPILDRTDVLSGGEWQEHTFCSHTYHQREMYWPTRALRTHRWKYHRNIAHQLNFPWASDLYASLSFEELRMSEKGGRIMLGKRTLEDYIRRPAEQLYDMDADPLEVNDLSQDPQYADVLKDLRDKLEAWQWDTEDLWFFRDGVCMRDLKTHLGDDHMLMPDRFDFDPSKQNLRHGVKVMDVKGDPNGLIRGGALYAGKNVDKAKVTKA